MQTDDFRAAQLFKELRINLWKLGDSPLLRWGAGMDNTGGYRQISLLLGMRVFPTDLLPYLYESN